jgi:hypothetical protein
MMNDIFLGILALELVAVVAIWVDARAWHKGFDAAERIYRGKP